MRRSSQILGLPTSILLLLISQSISVRAVDANEFLVPWPRHLTAHVKYWIYGSAKGSDEELEKDNTVVISKRPVGILKMGQDEGEKFFMKYWRFEGEDTPSSLNGKDNLWRERDLKEEARFLVNSSIPLSFRPPFALHTHHHLGSWDYEDIHARGKDSAASLAILEKRAFQCPLGTSSCSAIGYPNSCCAADETCFQITDTGLGPVGCCPSGGNCGGSITNCPSPNIPCADDVGGGCCIPSYVCAPIGCVINPSLVVVVTETSTVFSPTPSTTTQISTITSTRSSLSSSSSISSIWSPSQTWTPIVIATTATSALGVVPVRPTGDSTTTTTDSTSFTGDTCPTGFYACSAHYQGGCCRTGRNCDTTSCPATSSSTMIGSGITVAVPVGSAAKITLATGACATGWSSCAVSLGGDCCPSGWGCGTAGCESVQAQASATVTAVVPKEIPGMGGRVRGGGAGVVVGLMGILVAWLVL
ncbi:hypothetical protein DSL72_002617 [Monilinia vaccinii-corymbosi]|uniref:Gpi anchored protein n=1 Tax=Monilinia vaccinii-corymbosi TaxID=61207 RepID=A0A8A3PCZ3_9HELO|nr:hypothetical protein DSL72_002617 [Monilinia vaccinii-corymbosi]